MKSCSEFALWTYDQYNPDAAQGFTTGESDAMILESMIKRPLPSLVPVGRRGPVLRPSSSVAGIYGVDLTAGCGHKCVYCPVAVSSREEGQEDRIPFDPYTTEALAAALDDAGLDVQTIVLSPQSDPLVPFGPVRAEAVRVSKLILERGLDLVIMTRGRFSRRMVELLAAYPDQVRVGIGLFSLSKPLVRTMEPLAASPRGRIRDVHRLVSAGVPVEIRLEPLIPELTDTRDNLAPLFHALSDAGASRVVAHYLFQHPRVQMSLENALELVKAPASAKEMFAEGPKVSVGTLGMVRNLPREIRREGLARVMSWGAEFGLIVSTGSAQNPDLPRNPTPANTNPYSGSGRRTGSKVSAYPDQASGPQAARAFS